MWCRATVVRYEAIEFWAYALGGYAGPARLAHLSEYRLRPGDQLQVIYLITRRQKEGAYRLTPGDQVIIDSIVHEDFSVALWSVV